MKKSFLSALVFFGTIAVLTIGYATWNTPPMSTVWSGSGLTANGWNALVNNIDNLNARLEIAETTIINLSVSWAVMAFHRTTCPTGWSPADGGGTPARLDLRGEFIRGWDNGRGVDSGRTFGSLQAQDVQPITVSLRTQNSDNGDGAGYAAINVGTYGPAYQPAYGGGSETRPRNIALLYCIKD